MLMYVSRSWLAELYQHVLIANILELSCYKTQTTGHLALIDLLTGLYNVLLQAWINFRVFEFLVFLCCVSYLILLLLNFFYICIYLIY